MLKKIVKIIFYNTLLLIIGFIILEILSTNYNEKICMRFDGHKYFSKTPEFKYFSLFEFRKPSLIFSLPPSNKHDIVVAGCSFTYGDSLNDDETFSSVLSKFTNRNVYNIGISGGSPREILYILRNKNILNKLVDNPNNVEYFIYVFIGDHTNRLYYCNRPSAPFFLPIKNYTQLKYLEIPTMLTCSNLENYINLFLTYNRFYKNQNKLYELYIKEIKKEIENKFPGTKFIILTYEPMEEDIKCHLTDDGIKIIDVQTFDKKLNTLEYKIPNDVHPNAKAWQVIVPALAKELNL